MSSSEEFENDEFDLQAEDSSCNESPSECDENDDDFKASRRSKPKKAKNDLGEAMQKILQKSSTSEAPILEKYKVVDKILQEERELKKKQSVKRKERHELLEKDHVPIPDPSLLNFEKKLKKVATKEIVRLFNAINTHQKTTGKEKKEKLLPSKESGNFLEMLKK